MTRPHLSTIPLWQWGFQQCLPFSWTTLRAGTLLPGVVDTFEQGFWMKTINWNIFDGCGFSNNLMKKLLQLFYVSIKSTTRGLVHFYLLRPFASEVTFKWVLIETFISPKYCVQEKVSEKKSLLTLLRIWCTGKSLSEALIFASINPQYDNRLVMELPWKLQVQNMGRTCSGLVVIPWKIYCHIVG